MNPRLVFYVDSYLLKRFAAILKKKNKKQTFEPEGRSTENSIWGRLKGQEKDVTTLVLYERVPGPREEFLYVC